MKVLPIAGLLAVVISGPSSAQRPADGQFVVAPFGEKAPGGGRFAAPKGAVIGQGGHIAFQCRLNEAPPDSPTAIFVGKSGEWQRLLGKGDPVPGGPEGMVYRLDFTTLWVSPEGEVTVASDANYKEAAQFKTPRFLVAGKPGELHQLAVQGLAIPKAPPNFVFDAINAVANNGITAWTTHAHRIEGVPPNRESFVMAAKQGSVIPLLQEGIRVQGVPDKRATLNDIGMTDFGFGGGGLFVLKASLSDVDKAGTANLLLGVRPGKREEVLLRSGEPSPVAGWHFDNFNHPRPDDTGALLFRAIIKRNEPREDAQGFFHRDAAGKVTKIMASGDAAPGTGGKTFKDAFGYADGWLSAQNGHVLLQAPLDGVERDHVRGLWLWSQQTGELVHLAQQGAPAPGVPGATFKKFAGMAVNSNGQVAIGADLVGGPGRGGIWAGVPGDLKLIALDKGTIKVAEGSFEMGRPTLVGRQYVAGQGAALNDAGQLVYISDLRDFGSSVIMAELSK